MRLTYTEIISHKNFYRNNYRKLIIALLVSLGLNALLALLCFYFKITETEPSYFASNPYGIVQLQPREYANETRQSLLAPDPPEEAGEKSLSVN
jgi:hypothetical protein